MKRKAKVLSESILESTIAFSCDHCNREFCVDDSNAGKRGKCPKCGSIFTVPNRTQDVPIFEESMLSSSDPMLREIHESITRELKDCILQEQVCSDSLLRFDLLVDDEGRHQNVYVSCIDGCDWNADSHLYVVSLIGTATETAHIIPILHYVEKYPGMSLCLEDDYELRLRALYPMKQLNKQSLSVLVMQVASLADCWEAVIFEQDIK